VSATQEVLTAAPSRRAAAKRRGRFRGSLARVVIAKELALIARDPMLVAKSLLQTLYLLPMLVLLVRRADVAPLLAATLVVMASSLAATFAWLTISGEEAPDLLESSPVPRDRVRWLKVCAAVLPVGVMLLPFLAWYAWLSPAMLAIVAVFAAASVASAGVIAVWTGKPGSPRDMRARQKQSIVMNFVELFSSMGWAAACYCAITGHYWLVAPAMVLGLVGPGTAWLVRRWLERD
jgi:ABC-2 type transport system permease protein